MTTFEALKARVRELERQLSRGDRYKCLICMVSRKEPRGSVGQASAPSGGVEEGLRTVLWALQRVDLPQSDPLSAPSSLGLVLDAPDVHPVLARALRGVLAADPGEVAWGSGNGRPFRALPRCPCLCLSLPGGSGEHGAKENRIFTPRIFTPRLAASSPTAGLGTSPPP